MAIEGTNSALEPRRTPRPKGKGLGATANPGIGGRWLPPLPKGVQAGRPEG